jgi:hypothetical protein
VIEEKEEEKEKEKGRRKRRRRRRRRRRFEYCDGIKKVKESGLNLQEYPCKKAKFHSFLRSSD